MEKGTTGSLGVDLCEFALPQADVDKKHSEIVALEQEVKTLKEQS